LRYADTILNAAGTSGDEYARSFYNLMTVREITGSLFGTSSWSVRSITASYALNANTGGTTVVSGSTPGSSSISGSMWWNTEDGNLYIQVSDPTGSSWVPAVSSILATPVSSSYAETASYLSTPTICREGDINQVITANTTLYSAATRLNITGSATKFSIGDFTVGATGITPSVSGFYEIRVDGWCKDNGDGVSDSYFMIGVNNAEVTRTQISHPSGYFGSINMGTIHQVTAGQLVDFRGSTTSGGTSVQVRNLTITLRQVG
jgi:hypothetical protein